MRPRLSKDKYFTILLGNKSDLDAQREVTAQNVRCIYTCFCLCLYRLDTVIIIIIIHWINHTLTQFTNFYLILTITTS